MKKVLKGLIIVIFLGVFSFVLYNTSKDNKISYSEFNKMIDKKETFVLEFARDDCHFCKEYEPVIKKVIFDTGAPIYKFNLNELSEKELKDFDEKYGSAPTPTLIFFKDGEEISVLKRLEGYRNIDEVIKVLKDNNYIK